MPGPDALEAAPRPRPRPVPAPAGSPLPPDPAAGTDRGIARRIRRSLAFLVSAVLVAVSAYVWYTYRHFDDNVLRISIGAPRSAAGTGENILLIGDDHRPTGASAAVLRELSTGDDGGGLNTDTMIVMHVPANGKSASLISFPRDSWVDIPGHGMNKLNSAFQFGTENGGGDAGGARLLIRVIERISGLTINHFVRVSLLGFYQIAKVLGPIKVCLNEPAVDPLSGTDLPAGVSTLNAKQALSFVRQRHNLPNGDLDRERRQQYFLSVELRKIDSLGTLLDPGKLSDLLDAVSSSIETDSGLDLLSFAQQMQQLHASNLQAATIPVSGTPTIHVGKTPVSIVAIDYKAMPDFIASITGENTAYERAIPLAADKVRVTVLNGSGTNGAAAASTRTLIARGFEVGKAGSTASTRNTTIEYPAGMEAAAKALSLQVPGALTEQSSAVDGVTLILGGNGVIVPPAPSESSDRNSRAPTESGSAEMFGANSCIN